MKFILKQMNSIRKLFNKENKTILLCFLFILFILWIPLYFIPDLLTSLFETILGNLILFMIAVLVLSYNIKYGILISIGIIIVYLFCQLSIYNKNNKTIKESFVWDHKSTQDFLILQNTINPKVIFDVNMIQKSQASQEEVDYFNKNQSWPWSANTKALYIQQINRNPYVRVIPESSLNYAMRVYNEAAILRLISYRTKEGQFLLDGALVPDPSGNKWEDLPSGFGNYPYYYGEMENHSKDVIKCNMDDPTNAYLERIHYTGKGGIFGEQTYTTTRVDYNDLENIIPGFKFLKKPCNPCGPINENPDYTCPFNIKLKGKPYITDLYKYLWNLGASPLHSNPVKFKENVNPDQFPIKNEITFL